MESERKKAYCWAILAGINASLSAIVAKLFTAQIKYGLVVYFSALMWGSWVNSTKSLSSLQATVTNFATNFIFSGLAGFLLFGESLQVKWFIGAALIVMGVVVLSKSNSTKEKHD